MFSPPLPPSLHSTTLGKYKAKEEEEEKFKIFCRPFEYLLKKKRENR